MFKLNGKRKAINLEIERLMEKMQKVDVTSNEYGKMLEQVERLNKIKNERKRVSPDTLFTAGMILAQTLIVLKHEKLEVIAGKAWGLLPKWRV